MMEKSYWHNVPLRKKDSPGLWGPAVAGSVEEGETYESNIIKEAEEEIGLKNLKPILGPKVRRSGTHEYFAQVFFTIIPKDYPLVKQDEEVEEIRWFRKEELYKLLDEKPEMFLKNTKNYTQDFFNYYENKN
jgi:NADH pyrophosphatase NudC (nudix superfamily)